MGERQEALYHNSKQAPRCSFLRGFFSLRECFWQRFIGGSSSPPKYLVYWGPFIPCFSVVFFCSSSFLSVRVTHLAQQISQKGVVPSLAQALSPFAVVSSFKLHPQKSLLVPLQLIFTTISRTTVAW